MSIARRVTLRVSTLSASIFIVLLVATGVKRFSAWPQVIELWQGGGSFGSLVGHPHLFRFIVAYPGFVIEDLLPGFGFSVYCSFFLFFNARLWSEICCKSSFVRPSFIGWLVFFSAHLFMNGRGVIAWTAWLMCVSLCIDLSQPGRRVSWLPVRLFMSCFIAAVSTGVFVVVLISIAFFVVDAFRRGRFDFLNTKSGFILIFIIPFVYVFLDYFALAINKNLEFYGGGVQGAFNMLEHGLGRVFLSVGYLGFMFFIIALFLLFFAALIFYLKIRFSTVEKLFFISVLGGFFGFTVLTLAIPLALCEWVVLKHKFLGRLNRVMQN